MHRSKFHTRTWLRSAATALLFWMVMVAPACDAGDELRLPSIPDSITLPERRAAYLLEHYWQHFNFRDTTLCSTPETEQALVNFLSIMPFAADSVRPRSLQSLLTQAQRERRMYDCFLQLLEHYLYNPDSPMENDHLYAAALRHQSASPLLSDAERERTRFRLSLVEKNNEGEKSTDLRFKTKDGRTTTLHAIEGKGALLLLFFDPDCPDCKELVNKMKQNRTLEAAVRDGQLAVVAIDVNPNVPLWNSMKDELPNTWTCGLDQSDITGQALYDLKRMPTLYLLDASKRVLLKGKDFDTILKHIKLS